MKKPLILWLLLWAVIVNAQTPPAGATLRSKIIVPQSFKSAPYDKDQTALIPENFSLSVYTRISKARFLAIAPNGDLLVSVPSEGKVKLVKPNTTGNPIVSDFATGLYNPHDIVFHTIDATTYVYISESDKIARYVYKIGDTKAGTKEVVISGLPNRSTPELRGSYGHELKNIALDSKHKLYVSIASTCNVCLSDTKSNPIRASIYQYDADGKNAKLFAKGIRNAEGLAFVPGTDDLWVVINNRDSIVYPHQDNTGNYGKVVTNFMNNNPPEEFTKVIEGGNYGWPFCNPSLTQGRNDMPFDRDYQFNKDGAVDCSKMNRINKGINAHSAPLGLLFSKGTKLPAPYNNGAIAALHGSWNRSKATGYKVIFFPWNDATQTPGDEVPLVDGFLNKDSSGNFGRPVDIAIDQQGSLFISDDATGTILKLQYTGVTGTNEADNINYLLVTPQVADNKINATIETKIGGMAKISLVNTQGVDVFETSKLLSEGSNTVYLTPSLPSGVYFIKVSIGSKETVVKVPVTQ